MRKVIHLLLILFLCFLSNLCTGQIIIEKGNTGLEIGKFIEYRIAENSGEIYNFKDSAKYIFNTSDVINLGFRKTPIFLKFSVINKSGETQYLKIEHSLIKHIEIYNINNTHSKLLSEGGYLKPNFSNPFNSNYWIFEIPYNQDSIQKFLIKLVSSYPIQFPINISTKSDLLSRISEFNLFWGVFIGVMFFAFAYNLFIYLSIKETIYIYYLAYILLTTLFYTSLSGFTYKYLWQNFPILNEYLATILCSAGLFIIQFGLNFLSITKSDISKYYIGNALFVLFVINAVGVLLHPSPVLNFSAQILSVVSCFFFIIIGLQALKYTQNAKYYLLAFGTYFLLVVIYILADNNIIPSTFFTRNSMFIGQMADVVLLSLALGDKINFLKKEQLKLSEAKRLRAEAELKLILDRSRISKDLHDEVGSTLSSISILSHSTLQQPEALNEKNRLNEIGLKAREAINSISDIVWAVNPANDSLDKLVQRLIHYSSELIEATGGVFKTTIQGDMTKYPMEIEKRKDLYMILKEILNNISKYAEARNVSLNLHIRQNTCEIQITEDGKGFDVEQARKKIESNGLKNIWHRAENIGADISMKSAPGKGSVFNLSFTTI